LSSLCSFRLNKDVDEKSIDVLIVFLASNELRAEELSTLVDRQVQSTLAPDEMILVTRRTALAKSVSALTFEPAFEGVRNRLGRATISVVGFGAGGTESSRKLVRESDEISGMSLQEIGRRCVSSMFAIHGGFVEANSNYHFLNPSQRHTDRFIRLSNILSSSAEISLLAMTMLPLLQPSAEVAHVDTPAMFALVSAVNDHLRVLAPTRPWLRCENFRSYLGVRTHDFATGGEPVVLISASSSGSMAEVIAERSVPRDRIGHVLYLGKDDERIRRAVDLSFDEKENPEGVRDDRETFDDEECKLCAAGSIPVPLKGDQFDMGGPDFEPLTMLKSDAPAGLSATMDRMAGNQAFQVSTARGAGTKQFLVDAERLAGADEFIKRTAYLARRHVPSMTRECIVLDKDSKVFADLVMGKAGLAPQFIARSNLDELTSEDETEGGDRLDGLPIVVVAAVVESGRSLRDISRDLRRSRSQSPLIYLVGCAKNASPARREELEKTLVQTHRAAKHAFASVEELMLPASGPPHAWLAEIDFLNRALAQGIDLGEALTARLERLGRSSEPLIDDLFMTAGADPLRIQPGFVFWHAKTSGNPERSSQADVYYTISSVLQALRTNPPTPGGRALRTNWFQQTRLDPANLGRFNDGVIQASILRAARPVEIDYSMKDDFAREAGRAICRIMDAAHKPRGEAACEALIAIGSDRLRLPKDELERILENRETLPPLVSKLAAICRQLLL